MSCANPHNYRPGKYVKGYVHPPEARINYDKSKIECAINEHIHNEIPLYTSWENSFLSSVINYLDKNGFITPAQHKKVAALVEIDFTERRKINKKWLDELKMSKNLQDEFVECANLLRRFIMPLGSSKDSLFSFKSSYFRNVARNILSKTRKSLIYRGMFHPAQLITEDERGGIIISFVLANKMLNHALPLQSEYEFLCHRYPWVQKLKMNVGAKPEFESGTLVQIRTNFFKTSNTKRSPNSEMATYGTWHHHKIKKVWNPENETYERIIDEEYREAAQSLIFSVIESNSQLPNSTAKGGKFYSLLPLQPFSHYDSKILHFQERHLKRYRIPK